MPKLSIIVPTLVSRRDFRTRLVAELRRQVLEFGLEGQVELLVYEDAPPNQITTGAKRQDCLEKASGGYICCIDDDDRIADNYLQKVFEAMETNPDCITFCGEMSVDDRKPNYFVISLAINKWELKNDVYYRYPHHLCPIRKDIAKQGKYPSQTYGEDIAYANSIRDMLKTEAHIPEKIYFYDWVSNKINGEVVPLQQDVRRNTRQERAIAIKSMRQIQAQKRVEENLRRKEQERLRQQEQLQKRNNRRR